MDVYYSQRKDQLNCLRGLYVVTGSRVTAMSSYTSSKRHRAEIKLALMDCRTIQLHVNTEKSLGACEEFYLAWIRQPFPVTAASGGKSIVVNSTSGTFGEKKQLIHIFFITNMFTLEKQFHLG